MISRLTRNVYLVQNTEAVVAMETGMFRNNGFILNTNVINI